MKKKGTKKIFGINFENNYNHFFFKYFPEVDRHRRQQRPQLVALRQPNPQRRIFKIIWKLIKTKILPKNQD